MRQKNPLISVVIPVYNTKPYLDRCLESVVGQSYPNIEILLVDDGSTDRSGSACDKWAERDARIRVIHKQNEGLGLTRNCGMAQAKGDYLAFVDSDDYIDRDTMRKLLEIIVEKGGDACYGGCVDVAFDGSQTCGVPPERLEYSGREIITEFVADSLADPPESPGNSFAGVSVCGCLYDLAFLRRHKLLFESERDVLSEDIFFNIQVCKAAKKIVIAPHSFYYYCENQDSLTKKYRPDRYEAVKKVRLLLKKRLDPIWRENEKLRQRINRNYMDSLIYCMRLEVIHRGENGRAQCMRRLKKMAADPMTQEVLEEYPIARLDKKQRLFFQAVKKGRLWLAYCLIRLRYRI